MGQGNQANVHFETSYLTVFGGYGTGEPGKRPLRDLYLTVFGGYGTGKPRKRSLRDLYLTVFGGYENEKPRKRSLRDFYLTVFGGYGTGKPSKRSFRDHNLAVLGGYDNEKPRKRSCRDHHLAVFGTYGNEIPSKHSLRDHHLAVCSGYGRVSKRSFPGRLDRCLRRPWKETQSRRSLPDHPESDLAVVGWDRETQQTFSPRGKGSQADIIFRTPGKQFSCRWKGRTSRHSFPHRLGNICVFLQARDLQSAMVGDLWVNVLSS